MALGMSWLSTPAISVIAIVATLAIFIYTIKTIDKANLAYLFCMGLILGGAFGNITDRLVMGYVAGYGGLLEGHVIDFIHFTLTNNATPVYAYIFKGEYVSIMTEFI